MSRVRKYFLRPSDHSERLIPAVAVLLIIFVALVPIPAASNRPALWALTAAIAGAIGIVHFTGAIMSGSSLRIKWVQSGIPLVLLCVIFVYLVVQVLPLGSLLEQSNLAGPVSGRTISLAPGATILMMMKFGTYGLVGLLMLQVCLDRSRAAWILDSIFYVIAGHAAYALLALTQLGDSLLMLEKWAYEGSATGTFINRNSFATFLAFGIMIGLSLALRKLDKLRRPGPTVGTPRTQADWPGVAIIGACLLLQIAALVATSSRLGALSAIVGGGAMVFVYLSRQTRSNWFGFFKIMIVAMMAGSLALWLYGGNLLERLGSVQSSADVRGGLYAQVIGMIAQRPLTGYGGGAFEITFPFFHRLPVSPDLVWDKTHSTYLGLWVDLGLIFGTVPILIVAFAAVRLWLIARFRNRDWSAPLAGTAVIVVAAVHSIADFSLEIEANAIIFVGIIAIGMAAPTRAELNRRAIERNNRVREIKKDEALIDGTGIIGGVRRD